MVFQIACYRNNLVGTRILKNTLIFGDGKTFVMLWTWSFLKLNCLFFCHIIFFEFLLLFNFCKTPFSFWMEFSGLYGVYNPPKNNKEFICGLRYGGPTTESKNFKTPFFSRYSKFLLMSDWKWFKTYPVFFFSKHLNKYSCP